MRTAKQSSRFGETLYPDRLYQEHFTSSPPTVATKHIFVGQTRIASKVHHREQNASNRKAFMHANTFTYHADHLGSTNWVTDSEGEGYEHFQYTPYGESWVEEHLSSKTTEMTHRFTGQELDEETGMYSFPARYYEPRTSRWMSSDPAVPDYLPERPVDEAARKRNENLPGEGGVFNPVNLNVYHYAGNNPVKFVDPEGEETIYFGFNLTLINPVAFSNNLANKIQDIFARDAPDWYRTGPDEITFSAGAYLDTTSTELGAYASGGGGGGLPTVISAGVESGSSRRRASEFLSGRSTEMEAGPSTGFAFLQGATIYDEEGNLAGTEYSTGVGLGTPYVDTEFHAKETTSIWLLRWGSGKQSE